jgi:ATPase family associated with various cellular activities (AAA)
VSTDTDWQDANTRYLTAALAWLRALMESLTVPQQENQRTLPLPRPLPRESADRRNTPWLHLGRRPLPAPAQAPAAILPRAGGTAEQRIADAAAAMNAIAAEMKPPPPLLILAERLSLSHFERHLLTLCIAMELDTGLAGLCAQSQHDPNRPYPTFALGFALFPNPTWEALSPERPLRLWRLIEIMQSGVQPLTTSALRADERIVNYCKGLNYLDDRLLPLLSPIPQRANRPNLPASHRETVGSVLRRMRSNAPGTGIPIVQLLGSDSASKKTVASDVAASLDLHLYRLSTAAMPTQSSDADTFARLWQRESLLLPVALYVEAAPASVSDATAGGTSVSVTRLVDRIRGVVFLDTREALSGVQRPTAQFEIAKPTATEQAAEWAFFLDQNAGDSPAQLAAQFDLSFDAIKQLATRVISDSSDPTTLASRSWDACLAETRPDLDILAQRIPPKASWKDLVLPAPELALLHQIADQIRQRNTVYEKWGFAKKMSRGLGVSALFAGDSGTGKTLAAEVIAAELQLNLYRIDLSAVVSKYIGETEKNLRKLFDSAENGGAILFFDEADALFGKRSEVKDSHDRYANIEINYLLQRMEAYRGLAILATNMKSALDPAFMRRLRFIVSFPFPGPAQRKSIWQSVFPDDMPHETLDYDRLSRLHATGGNIHSIALNAAFLAAKAGSPVTMPLVLEAARAEFSKLERPINEVDFRWSNPKAVA